MISTYEAFNDYIMCIDKTHTIMGFQIERKIGER